MSPRTQGRLALAAVAAALAVVLAANAHLVVAAFRSQPACVSVDGAVLPAKRVC